MPVKKILKFGYIFKKESMKTLLPFIFICVFHLGFSQENTIWNKISANTVSNSEKVERNTTPKEFQIYSIDFESFKSSLSKTISRKNSTISAGLLMSFPMANGTTENFRIYENSVMHADLAIRYKEINSYIGIGVDNPTATIYFSTTIFGLHAMVFSGNSDVTYIDTYTKDLNKYVVYSRNNVINNGVPFECNVEKSLSDTAISGKYPNATMSNNGILRTYRLAISSTVEYSTFHINQAGLSSGTIDQKRGAVLAAMNVTMVRINGLYERDLAVHLELIPNNDILICITSDNFTNNDGFSLLGENQSFVNINIGSGNYDIGHIFSTGGGGVASLGSVCSTVKAQGVTGSPSPINDPFNIDYVAHEMGHQFGANHTFNSDQGFCGGGNRNDPTAVEPGSGTTIMAYAGICSPHNVQNNSDAHFSFKSLEEINSFLNSGGGGTCAVNTVYSNTAPVISNLSNYTIPKGTAFVLKGNATDAENDPLTYCWEQNNNEVSTQPPLGTNLSGPNFRSRPPSNSPNRYLPALNESFNNYEVVPTVPRILNFVLTVRDNSINGAQTSRGNMALTIANVGPFVITSPNTNITWAAATNQIVTWDVAGTTANGINAAFVDIYLSIDGGSSYPTLLASKVPNDGSETIVIPNNVGFSNKIMVMANNNLFYDISNANFSIANPSSTFAIAFNGIEGEQNKGACAGNSAVYTFDYTPVAGFSGTTTFSATGNPTGSTVIFSPSSANSAGPITMTINTNSASTTGIYPITVTGTSGATTKAVNFYLNLTSGAFISQNLSSPADQSVATPTDVTLSWAANSATTNSYIVEIATDVNFTNIVNTATVTSTSYLVTGLASITQHYWRVTPKNDGCNGTASATYTFKTGFCGVFESSNVPLAISASGTPTINSTLTVSPIDNIIINSVNVTLNISHERIGNISARLISPTGTEVVLFANICGPLPGYKNAVASFDDSGITLTCSATLPSVSGRVKPNQPLSAFSGQNSQGTWTLRVIDNANGNGGSINSWSINFCSPQAPLTVDDSKIASGIKVFPNPSNGTFTVQSDKISSDNVHIQVYDLRGRIIFDNSYSGKGKLNEEIRLNNAQAGIYLLSVSDGENKEVKRIIIE